MPSLASAVRVLLLGIAFTGCGGEAAEESPTPPPPVSFERDEACIVQGPDTLRLSVELAENDAQRAYGLMERDSLDPGAGMLFTYEEPQPAESGYWMYRTRIPLDIAYLGADGEILSIIQMQPCSSPDPRWCPSYPAGLPFQGALETNAGYFASRGIAPGAHVVRAGQAGCPRARQRAAGGTGPAVSPASEVGAGRRP